jgi:hypothetical protein
MRRVTGGARTYDLWAFAGGRFILGSVVLRSFRQQAIAYALSEYSAYLSQKREPTSGLEPPTCSSYE